MVGHAMRAVLGHERILEDQVLAPRAEQTRDLPACMVDREVVARHEERSIVRTFAFIRNDPAEERPAAVGAAARESPATGQLEAAVDTAHLTRRSVSRGD